MKLLTNDHHYDAIANYLVREGGTLTAMQETLLGRWTTAHELLLMRHSEKDVANILVERFDISGATAVRDVKKAKKLFGSANPMNVKYRLNLLWDWIMEDLNRAREAGDVKIIPGLYKQLIEILVQAKEYDQDSEEFDDKITEIVALPEEVGFEPVNVSVVDNIMKDYHARRERLPRASED